MNVAQKAFAKISAALSAQEAFAYSDIFSLPLSAQSQAFISAELLFSARALIGSLKSTRFDLQDASLNDAREAFAQALTKTVRFQRDELLKLLETAIDLEAQYLARPQKILKDLVFADRAERSVAEIKDRLRIFKEYPYLTHVFEQYLERKQPESLSAEKFATVIAEIDSKMCSTYSTEELLALFKPLYEFYRRADEKAVDCATLSRFLGEKKLSDFIKRIELATQNGIETLTLEALEELLRAPMEALLPKPAPTPESSAPKSEPSVSGRVPSAPAPIAHEPPKPSAPEIAPSIVAQAAPQSSATATTSEPTKPDDAKEKKAPQIDFFELEKQRLQAKRPQEPALRDVRLLIDDDERKRFVKRLFKGNEAEYEKAIAAINEKKTWREASLFIDHEIFSRFKVDEFSSEAVAFVDIVFERYQNR